MQETGRFIFLSELLGRPLLTPEGEPAGRLHDLKVRLGEPFPAITAVLFRRRGERKLLTLPWSDVDRLEDRDLALKPGAGARAAAVPVGGDELLLREDLLDKQVVDTQGARIERVNDIHLLVVGSSLRIVHVDFGIRGILRRLGWMKAIDRLFAWLFSYQIPSRWISWKYVQPLAADPRSNLKINVTQRSLHQIHPSDLADILEELDRANRSSVFQLLDTETAAETLQEVDPDLQLQLIETAPAEKASDILEEMEPDEAADFLSELPEEEQQRLMETMEPPAREEVQELMKFEEGTAGSIMTTDYIALPRAATIADALKAFREVVHPLETIAYIYVLDAEERIVGVLTVRHLLTCDPAARIDALMNPHVVKVETEERVKDVVELFRKYKFIAVPVVDKSEVLRGIITLQDVMQAQAES